MAEEYEYVPDGGELIEAFKIGVRDGNGFISAQELRHGITDLGGKPADGAADEEIRMADVDGDGQINCEEFVKVWGGALVTWRFDSDYFAWMT